MTLEMPILKVTCERWQKQLPTTQEEQSTLTNIAVAEQPVIVVIVSKIFFAFSTAGWLYSY